MNKNGFTLVEVMVVTGILGFVMVGVVKMSESFFEGLEKPNVKALFCTLEDFDKNSSHPSSSLKTLIPCENPKGAFFTLNESIYNENHLIPSYIHPTASIHPLAFIDELGVEVREGAKIGPFVSIYRGTIIGKNVKIESGSTIGSSAHMLYRSADGQTLNAIHQGSVFISDEVEVGSNSVISKSLFSWDSTFIGKFTKIGSMCNISHGVSIGRRNHIASSVDISGYTQIGNTCWLGPGSKLSNSLKIGSDAFITLGSVVLIDLEANSKFVMGKVFKERKMF